VFKPDVIHIVNPAFLGLVGLRHARELDIPVVASYHTDLPGYTERYGIPYLRETVWAYFRWIHNQADLNLCPSQYTKDELVAHRFQRVRIWGRGVDTDRFNPKHWNQTWRNHLSGGHPEATLLLFVSRLAQEKRVDWLRPLLDVLPDVRLAIVGEGPARSELEELFQGTPTVFTGYLQGQSLSQAYASADVFVFPSASETFGNVVTEAMASGLPVVAARAGGPVDHVRDWETGFLFNPDSTSDMIDKVKQVIDTPGLVKKLSHNARAYAETQTWEAIFDGLLEDYRSAPKVHKPSRQHQYNQWVKKKLSSTNFIGTVL
jgi:glycosyltransferase involved in cell wall biosynthesis